MHCFLFYVLSSIVDVLSINPSAIVFFFGDINVCYKDRLTYSVKLIDLVNFYNFFISNDLTQIVNFPSQTPDCDSHSPALLDLFISSDASISYTLAFLPLGNSDQVAVSVSINFQKTPNRMPHSITWLINILMLIRMVFRII